ncbi:MAG: hypothetical protein A2X36_00800 [Elusimicrobia bacterium GWA2_69_24]|nr:MAG: hypothetical protein A2X36_00800 [Elusimicrobia bacterium GWA2_69_24]
MSPSAACLLLLLAGSASAEPPVVLSSGPLAALDQLYLHRDQGDNLERSRRLLEERLQRDPKDAPALWRLGRSLVRLGEAAPKKEKADLFFRAEAAAARAAELDPKDAEAAYWSGVAMGRKGQSQGLWSSAFMIKPIRRRMEQVLALDPGHGRAHLVLGELYRRLPGALGGSQKRGLRELESALRLSPRCTAIHPKLAEAYLDAGRTAEARGVLEDALQVSDPEDPAEFPDNLDDVRALLKSLGP